jgi:mycothiol synthase
MTSRHDASTDPLTVSHDGARATASRSERGWELELTAGTGRLDVVSGTTLLTSLVEAIAARGGGVARWRVPVATPEHHRIASAAGFRGDRRLVQMRRSLPVPWPSQIETRAFVPGRDDHDWLRVNNAAFSWHPEQSDWTLEQLHDRVNEDWFDATGFLVHPTSGPLTGFCWTKVHHELHPPLGEIFVIGVHPDAAGHGLGRSLVLAGLEHLSERGLQTAMLYTEADNHRARVLYDRLGFSVHHEVTVFERQVGSDPNPDQ